MAEVFKVLDQINPLAATLTASAAVPASKAWIVSSIVVANRDPVGTTFRIAVAPAAAADSNEQYLWFDVSCPGNDTFAASLGLTLATTDIFRVYATLATLSFNFFGSEVDQ